MLTVCGALTRDSEPLGLSVSSLLLPARSALHLLWSHCFSRPFWAWPVLPLKMLFTPSSKKPSLISLRLAKVPSSPRAYLSVWKLALGRRCLFSLLSAPPGWELWGRGAVFNSALQSRWQPQMWQTVGPQGCVPPECRISCLYQVMEPLALPWPPLVGRCSGRSWPAQGWCGYQVTRLRGPDTWLRL